MIVLLMMILIVTVRLRDTVRTFQQVKSPLDSTLEKCYKFSSTHDGYTGWHSVSRIMIEVPPSQK